MNLKAQIKSYRKGLVCKIAKSRLEKERFTIISNNCWGGEIYRSLNLAYQSPFVGLLIFAPCYIKLLRDFKSYLSTSLTFIPDSRYEIANQNREKGTWEQYPIGLLGGEVEIHFMHYASEAEAREKWDRRAQRISWDEPNSLFFKFCDRDLCNPNLLEEFDHLELPHKICFTSKQHPNLQSSIWVKEYRNHDCVADGATLYRVGRKYFDVIDWLNGGSGQIKLAQKMINTVIF